MMFRKEGTDKLKSVKEQGSRREKLELIPKQSKKEDKPTIEIRLYTHKNKYCCPFMPCSHMGSTSSAIVKHLPTNKEYVVGFIRESQLRRSIKSGYYSKHTPPIIYAYENADKTFENFTKAYNAKFPPEIWAFGLVKIGGTKERDRGCSSKNCADATTFAIDYFPRQPADQSLGVLYWSSRIGCGFFGSYLGIRACPTFPCVRTPVEVESRAHRIEKEQRLFFEKNPISGFQRKQIRFSEERPQQQKMMDDEEKGKVYKKNTGKP